MKENLDKEYDDTCNVKDSYYNFIESQLKFNYSAPSE